MEKFNGKIIFNEDLNAHEVVLDGVEKTYNLHGDTFSLIEEMGYKFDNPIARINASNPKFILVENQKLTGVSISAKLIQ